MQGLNPTALLAAWEEGAGQLPLRRAITLLTMAWPERSAAEWAGASIGERDRGLLRLREDLFGPRFDGVAVCPACGQRLQLTFSTHDITVPAPALAGRAESLRLESAGYEVVYHLPTTADLLAVSDTGDPAGLLKRSVEVARRGGEVVDPAQLPDEVASAVSVAMAQADPQAEVRMALACPACSHQWTCLFDILSFLWGEIEDWVQRIVREVHILASAYGWTEAGILALSPRRRRIYLEMVGA